MKPHAIFMYIPLKSYMGICNSSVSYVAPSKAFVIWFSQNSKFQLPRCCLFSFSLFFLAGQSVLWQHFLGELLFCGNQAILEFCRRVIFNLMNLLAFPSLTMHSGSASFFSFHFFFSKDVYFVLSLAGYSNSLTPFRKVSAFIVFLCVPVMNMMPYLPVW